MINIKVVLILTSFFYFLSLGEEDGDKGNKGKHKLFKSARIITLYICKNEIIIMKIAL